MASALYHWQRTAWAASCLGQRGPRARRRRALRCPVAPRGAAPVACVPRQSQPHRPRPAPLSPQPGQGRSGRRGGTHRGAGRRRDAGWLCGLCQGRRDRWRGEPGVRASCGAAWPHGCMGSDRPSHACLCSACGPGIPRGPKHACMQARAAAGAGCMQLAGGGGHAAQHAHRTPHTYPAGAGVAGAVILPVTGLSVGVVQARARGRPGCCVSWARATARSAACRLPITR